MRALTLCTLLFFLHDSSYAMDHYSEDFLLKATSYVLKICQEGSDAQLREVAQDPAFGLVVNRVNIFGETPLYLLLCTPLKMRRVTSTWLIDSIDLLLRHGADTERVVEKRSINDVVEYLSLLQAIDHLIQFAGHDIPLVKLYRHVRAHVQPFLVIDGFLDLFDEAP